MDLPVEDVVGVAELVADRPTDGLEGRLPQVRQRLHTVEMGVHQVQVLGRRPRIILNLMGFVLGERVVIVNKIAIKYEIVVYVLEMTLANISYYIISISLLHVRVGQELNTMNMDISIFS